MIFKIIAIVLILVLIAGALFERFSVEGYEDADGFHFGKPKE